ncbi:NUDIX hydrolase [Kineosporia mesophila]|uniref:NUDIX hydrolase n=2 Tax=Kineosporia mesophila TaxID=566012 RepID=A0ABP6Z6L0_9ACTN
MVPGTILAMDPAALKTQITDLVEALTPHDELGLTHQATTREWLAGTDDIYRRAKPRTPSPHLVTYVLLIDRQADSVLLCDHRLAGLWLPVGGHVEPAEHPYDTVRRETTEELGITATPDPVTGPAPFFLTVTETRDTPDRRHTDVSLWFALTGRIDQHLTPDPGEFAEVRWWKPSQIRAEDPAAFDPHLSRALASLAL